MKNEDDNEGKITQNGKQKSQAKKIMKRILRGFRIMSAYIANCCIQQGMK